MEKKQNIFNITVILSLIIYNFLYKFVILKFIRREESEITCIFFILLFITSVVMFGFAKSKLNIPRKKTTRLVAIVVVAGIAVTYCIGAFVGFVKNGYSLAITNIIKNTLPPLIIIVFTEFFRYNIIRANKNKFKMIVIVTILLTILEIQMNMGFVASWGFQEIFIAATTIVIPIIAKNLLLSYLTYEVGYQPCLIYRLILEIYIYLVPYLPKFGDYLNSMFGLIMPMVTFTYVSTDADEVKNTVEPEFVAKRARLLRVPMYVTIFIAIALISRVFPVFAIGIGSESMTGAINKGDATIAVKVKEENINVNDIIVFQTQDKTLIHRVVEIEEIAGIKHYRTKGDVNGTRDNVDVTIDKIYGKTFVRIPYIAYPSVWLSEFIQSHK